MSNLAINDAGDVLTFDGQIWKPAPMAANDRGEKVVFDGSEWKPLGGVVQESRNRQAREKGSTPQGRSDAAANAFGQGATFGFGDELAAGVRAALPQFSNWMMSGPALKREGDSRPAQTVSTAPTMEGRYDEELARQRAQTGADAKAYPAMTTGANIAGNVATSALMLPAAATAAGPSLVGNMAKVGGAGAVLGGAQGFGEGEGGFQSRAGNAVMPAVIGGALGAAMPVVGAGARYAYEKAAPPVLSAVGDFAERFVPRRAPVSLSAAAPEGGSIAQGGLAATIADTARSAAGGIDESAAMRRLALELERSGGTAKARQELGELGEAAFLADTSRGARRLAELGVSLPGEAGEKYGAAFAQRNEQAGQRFLGAMGEQAKVPSIADAQRFLQAYKSRTGSELYDPVLRGGNFNISDEMKGLLQTPAIREAMDQIIADGERYGVQLGAAEAAHLVKQTLNKNVEAAFQSGKAINKDMVRKAGDAWERALWSANPAIKEADTSYAKVASLPDWLERGQNFMRAGQSEGAINVSPGALAIDLPGATQRQIQTLRAGASNVMRDAALGGPESTRRLAKTISDNQIMRDKLTEIYGAETADALLRQSKAQRRFAETSSRVMGGSPTAERLAAQADDAALSIPQGGPTSPASLIQMLANTYAKARQPSDRVRSRLADLLANPDATMNAETLRLVDALIRQRSNARPVGAGFAGAAGGATSSP